MLILLYLVLLCSNFLFIKSEDNGNVTIDVKAGENCTTKIGGYTFTDGLNVTLVIKSDDKVINHGWWRINSSTGIKDFTITENEHSSLYTHLIDKSMEGEWEFKFYYYRDNRQYKINLPKIQFEGHNYTESICRTKVRIVPPKPTDNQSTLIIIVSVVGVIALITIIAQAAYIVLLKAKARKLITLNTHNNLSKKTDSAPNDSARYCSNPGQKMMKVPTPVEDNNRDSVIYEAPNIEISCNPRMPMQPPQPPAITTMPRTPRSDHNMKIDPQSRLASALNSPARSPMSESLPPNFSRLNHMEREINVANRPPLPLPPQGHSHDNNFQELYEEMNPIDENTYEPPPVINTMPPRLPMPPKKVPTGNLLNVKDNTLKSRQSIKPAVTPKPMRSKSNVMTPNLELEKALRRRNNDTTTQSNAEHLVQSEHSFRRRPNADAQTNELEEALRRRNNVKPVPIMSIPDPSSRASPKFRPPPVAKKSKGPPVPQPAQEEIYYNENQASSDEEWTYEPLKPLNSYDPNIYNV